MADNIAPYPPLNGQPTSMNCVYAISGTYGLLPRVLFYATLALAIFGRTREWLVIGALVSALTYAGTAAIHSMTLASSKTTAFDLDIYGCWAILSTGALGYVAMVHWSTTLRNSRARVVVIAWGCLVGVSLIFEQSLLFSTQLSDSEPPCYSSTGKLLEYPIELVSPQFNCTYECFSARKPLRQPSEVMAVPLRVVKNQYSDFAVVLVGPIMFAAYASISLDPREHTPSQLCTRLVMRYLNPNHHEDITKLIYNASSERWYGGYFVLYSFVHRQKWSLRKFIISFLCLPWIIVELAIDVFCLPLMIINVVLNELMILGSNLPTNEANYAIGQWGPIVSSALVIIAALINKYLEEREKRKAGGGNDIVREESDHDPTIAVPDIELGQMQEGEEEGKQSSGIVIPRLKHVQTLKESEMDARVKPKK